MKICFATNNQHKLDEARQILGKDFIILSLKDIGCLEELPETSDTFQGNSFQKAAYVFDKYKISCFSDDSGLEVDALNGAPGVFSARYAGLHRNDDNNNALLLQNLNDCTDRSAQFKTVITYIDSKGHMLFDGIIRGTILKEKRGSNGFGYDPLFVPASHSQTFAEMESSEKNKLSHRSIAIRKLAEFLIH